MALDHLSFVSDFFRDINGSFTAYNRDATFPTLKTIFSLNMTIKENQIISLFTMSQLIVGNYKNVCRNA